MPVLIIEKIDTKKVDENVLVEMTLCNKSKNKYFIENRFIHSSDDRSLAGFKVNQNGKLLRNKGRKIKRKPSEFPDDYKVIQPENCISFTVILNNFFDFDHGQDFTLSYLVMNSNPLTDELDEISFDDKKISIGK